MQLTALHSILTVAPGSVKNMKKLISMFAGQAPKFFTFNDGWNNKRPKSADFAFGEFLAKQFPTPSQFELADAPW